VRQCLDLGCLRLQASEVRLSHLPIAGQAKEQGHIYIDAPGDQLLDRWESPLGRWDLDHGVGAMHRTSEPPGLSNGAVGVMGQMGRHFQTYKPIPAVGGSYMGWKRSAARWTSSTTRA
jgi:hypothetical protein